MSFYLPGDLARFGALPDGTPVIASGGLLHSGKVNIYHCRRQVSRDLGNEDVAAS